MSGPLYAFWFKYTFSVELASTENVAGHDLYSWLVLCRNNSLDLFQKVRNSKFLDLYTALLLALQSIPKKHTATWVLSLRNDWWFFKAVILYQSSWKSGENWPLFVFFLYEVCPLRWMYSILGNYFEHIYWPLADVSITNIPLMFFWCCNVWETSFCLIFRWKHHNSVQRTTLQLTSMWKWKSSK